MAVAPKDANKICVNMLLQGYAATLTTQMNIYVSQIVKFRIFSMLFLIVSTNSHFFLPFIEKCIHIE